MSHINWPVWTRLVNLGCGYGLQWEVLEQKCHTMKHESNEQVGYEMK